MISSILDAVKSRETKAGATTVTAETPFPAGRVVSGWSDGAVSGGNPGQMGVGYYFAQESGVPLAYAGGQIGHGSNNEAEYHALILGLRHALRLGFWSVVMHTDSELIQRQMEGRYAARHRSLRNLLNEARTLGRLFSAFKLVHVPREQNAVADELSHRIVYMEPELPPLRRVKGQVRVLHDFQAAAIRSWGLRKLASTYVLERIFRVNASIIESIVAGKTYRKAAFDLPLLLSPVESVLPLMPALAGAMRDAATQINIRGS